MNRRNFLATTVLAAMAPVDSLLAATSSKEVLTFEDTVLEFDKVNSNNRLYPRSLLNYLKLTNIVVTNKMKMHGMEITSEDVIGEVETLFCRWYPKDLTLCARVRFFKPQNVEGMTLRTFGVGYGKMKNGILHIGDEFKLTGVALIPKKIACTWN